MATDKVTDSGGTNGRAAEVVEEWRNAAYNCFSSGHKFCREVCPVMQVTRDERHTPTAFHANVVAMDEGHLTIEDVAEDYVHCTMCGACELRCPNTLFTGDFYRFRQRTIDVVRAMRTLAVEEGIHQENWKRWAELTDRWGNEPVLGWRTETSGNKVRAWAAGLDLPTGGETVLFADCEAAFYRPSVPRAVALLLRRRRRRVRPHEPAVVLRRADVGDRVRGDRPQDGRAQHDRLAQDGHDARHLPRPARLHHDDRALPHDFDENFDEFEIVLGVDLVAELIREGKIELTDADRAHGDVPRPVPAEQAPRKWHPRARSCGRSRGSRSSTSTTSRSGRTAQGPARTSRPRSRSLTAEISRRRIEKAAALDDVDTLVSACPWSERPLTEQGKAQGIEVFDIFELVAESAGFEV